MFDFKFGFLTPEQNELFSEAVNCFFGYEMEALKAANRSLNKRLYTAEENAAFLQSRSEKLTAERQEACREAEKLKEELREVRLELMDSRRANVVLRESLEMERERAAAFSAPRSACVDVAVADDVRFQNEVMDRKTGELRDELRRYRDFAARMLRTAKTAPKGALEDSAAGRSCLCLKAEESGGVCNEKA
ncbi:hypothetical protein [Cloacibacillus porcorum]|uniref:hypothetical protein n=1 Tax=Cloacibacillus porcorum TaxID=1197717 RepID=UPI00258A954F|nr:hypothetical protein [Cloacibacillus porcorum]